MSVHLSQLLIDVRQQKAARTLAAPTRLHQAVFAGFDAAERGDSRVLFRLEPQRRAGPAVILVQSLAAPSWEHSGQAFFGDVPEHRRNDIDPVGWQLAPGTPLRFRLRANPTRRVPGGHLRRSDGRPCDGKRHAILGEQAQLDWLARKLSAAGAQLADCLAIDEGLLTDPGPGGRQFQSVLYEGHLRVREPSLLVAALLQGIGPAKAFGFGLLSLARAG